MPEEQVHLATPVFTPAARVIAAPFQFLTTGEDHLRLESWCSTTDVTVAVHGRWQPLTGAPKPFAYTHRANSDRTRQRTDHALEEGFLLNLTVFATAGTPVLGELFVSLKLIRGLTGATFILGTLLQGYVAIDQHLGWPGSPIDSSHTGRGVVRRVLGTDPAAGASILETVPAGARWHLKSAAAQLVTSATAGTRHANLTLDSGSDFWFVTYSPGTQGASATVDYQWAEGCPFDTVINTAFPLGVLPSELPLLPGFRVGVTADNLDGSDNFGAPVLVVREWLEVDA